MSKFNAPSHLYATSSLIDSSSNELIVINQTWNLQKLNTFTRAPDYIAYLAYILTAMPEQEERIRTIAGYLLKNNARLILNASPDIALYVKASVLQAFTDTSIMIRNAAGQDIVAFLGALEPKNWPECLEQLVALLDSPELDRQEVSKPLTFTRWVGTAKGVGNIGALMATQMIYVFQWSASTLRPVHQSTVWRKFLLRENCTTLAR